MTILPLLQATAGFTKEYQGAWAMMVAGIGLAARVTDQFAASDGRLEATVIKPGAPVTASVSEPRTIR